MVGPERRHERGYGVLTTETDAQLATPDDWAKAHNARAIPDRSHDEVCSKRLKAGRASRRMCGIVGLFQRPGTSESEQLHWAEVMASTLVHRGPDDAGRWAESAAGVAFGFRRLAIIDLSPNGHQPMSSATGRYTMVFN